MNNNHLNCQSAFREKGKKEKKKDAKLHDKIYGKKLKKKMILSTYCHVYYTRRDVV